LHSRKEKLGGMLRCSSQPQVRYVWKRLAGGLGQVTITSHLGIDRAGKKTGFKASNAHLTVKTQTEWYFSPSFLPFVYFIILFFIYLFIFIAKKKNVILCLFFG